MSSRSTSGFGHPANRVDSPFALLLQQALPATPRAWAVGVFVPNLTPILLTLPLALELLPASTHRSATFRTDAVHNAGDHLRRYFAGAQSEIRHVSPL